MHASCAHTACSALTQRQQDTLRRVLPVLLLLLLLPMLALCTAVIGQAATDATHAGNATRELNTDVISQMHLLTPRQTLSLDGDAILQLVRAYEAEQQRKLTGNNDSDDNSSVINNSSSSSSSNRSSNRSRRHAATRAHVHASNSSSRSGAAGDVGNVADDKGADVAAAAAAALNESPLLIMHGADKTGAQRTVLLRRQGVVIALTADHPAHRDAADDQDTHDNDNSSEGNMATDYMAGTVQPATHDAHALPLGVPAALGNYASGEVDARGTLVVVTATLIFLLITLQFIF